MTTTDTLGAGPQRRLLRRSRSGRVAAGVSAGLGEYFGVDPVLFRVLFATSAFFGGAGILAYLLAWAAVPDEGTEHAPIDGWVQALRRRHVPLWVVVVVGLALFWLVAFSWWSPRPIVPVIVVGIVVAVALSRREMRGARTVEPPPGAPAGAPTVSLEKGAPLGAADPAATRPAWVGDMRSWFDDARTATRARRRRTLPVRLATVITFVVTWTVLGVVDATTGLPLTVYLWSGLGIVVLGLLVGAALRRFPAGLIGLLVPLTVATVGLAGTHAQLGDGIGQRDWIPSGAAHQHFKLAFGQGRLDLTRIPASALPSRIDVTTAAGRVILVVPPTANVTVLANVRFGDVEINGVHSYSGAGISRVVGPPAGATGKPVTIDVHLADGNVDLDRS